MTDRPRPRLTPQQRELARKMREADETARRDRPKPRRKRSLFWLVVAAVVLLILLYLALLDTGALILAGPASH